MNWISIIALSGLVGGAVLITICDEVLRQEKNITGKSFPARLAISGKTTFKFYLIYLTGSLIGKIYLGKPVDFDTVWPEIGGALLIAAIITLLGAPRVK